MYVIAMHMSHNRRLLGYRGPNDKIVPRVAATRYKTHDGAAREAQELMEDNADHLCIVQAA